MKMVPLRLHPGADLLRALEAWMVEQQEQGSCESVLGLRAGGRQPPLYLQKHQPGHPCRDAAGPVIAQQLDDRNRAGADAQSPQQEAA